MPRYMIVYVDEAKMSDSTSSQLLQLGLVGGPEEGVPDGYVRETVENIESRNQLAQQEMVRWSGEKTLLTWAYLSSKAWV